MKVQRDDVLDLLTVDAVAVRSFVALISQLFSTETDFAAIADEIVGRISDELDYAREASDCELFSRLYKNADVCVPKVYREFCGPRVLTLSYLPGTKLDESDHGRTILIDGQDIGVRWRLESVPHVGCDGEGLRQVTIKGIVTHPTRNTHLTPQRRRAN